MEVILEDYVPYEEHLRWRVHDAYFAESGITPWTSRSIPQETTNGYPIAILHARLLTAAAEALGGDEPLPVLEVGAGSGRFAWGLFDCLEHDCGEAGRATAGRLQYIMTDYNPRTIEAAATSPLLLPLVEAGRILPARCDVRRPSSLAALDGSPIDGPLFALISNYVACATPARWVQRRPDGFYRCYVQTSAEVSEEESAEDVLATLFGDPTVEGMLDGLYYTIDWRPEQVEVLGGGARGGSVIERFTEGLEKATLCYPHAFIGFLDAMSEKVVDGGLVCINDLGYAVRRELKGLRMPSYRHYGNTLNHPIAFGLFETWADEAGFAHLRTADELAPLQSAVLVRGEVPDGVQRAFRERVLENDDLADYLDFAESALISIERGDHHRALRLFRRCLPLDPRGARLRFLLTETAVNGGYHEEALAWAEEGMALPDAADWDWGFILGRACAALRRSEEAIQWFERSLEREPHAITYSNLGELYGERGELETAYAMWRRAVDLEPEHPRATERLEWLKEVYWTQRQAELDRKLGL